MYKCKVLFALIIVFLSIPSNGNKEIHRTLGLTLKYYVNTGSVIIHQGNLTIANDEVYIIDDCYFQQNGTIIVKDNATLVFRNSLINQTNKDSNYITLMNNAKIVMENSTYLIFQNHDFYDIKISLCGHATLSATFSNLTNTHCGMWIWMEDFSRIYLTNTVMYGYGTGSRIIADDCSRADIHDSKVDFIVCWGYSLVNVYNSVVSEGVKAFSAARINLLTSRVNYMWAFGASKIKVQSSTVYSISSYEKALRAGGESEVCFFYSSLEGDINVGGFAKVRLKSSHVENIYACDNSIIWLINSVAMGVLLDDQAIIYNLFINLFSRETKVLHE